MNGSESGQQETMHNSRPIDALSPTIHTPHSCLALQCQIHHQSYSLHTSVSKLTLRSHKAIQAQLFTVLCIFRYDGSIIRSDTCALIKAGSCKNEAGIREDTTSKSATSVAPIASSALALAVATGEHSTEGSETSSGASADLCVDSAKRYHLRQVGVKPTYNKFKYRLSLNKESARDWAELKASSTSTALQLEECEQTTGEWRKATREHEAGTHQHRRTRCPKRTRVLWHLRCEICSGSR